MLTFPNNLGENVGYAKCFTCTFKIELKCSACTKYDGF